MLGNNNNATNPKPPFDFHEIMIVLLLILLVVYSVRAAIWFLMH
nr:MAG TPA: FeoB-associated Cys-rich membrane protein [Caudoviricetes sp.]